MSRLTILYFILLVTYLPANCQIDWLNDGKVQLGQVRKGEVYPITFSYKNNGLAPLIIDNIRTSCGCVAPDWSSEPIFAGESGVIQIEWRPSRRGFKKEKIKVYFKATKEAHILTIDADVK